MLFASERYVNEKIQEIEQRFQVQLAEMQDVVYKQVEEKTNRIITSIKVLSTEVSALKQKTSDIVDFAKSLQTEVDVIQHELNEEKRIDLSPLHDKIAELDQQTVDHFKIVHDTMSMLSDIVTAPPVLQKSDAKEDRRPGQTQQYSSLDRRLVNLDEKHIELAEKVDAAIELILDKLASKMSEEDLPPQLVSDRCPFKAKQGYCALWAARKNKSDAMVYCTSCLQATELLDKGIRF